MTKDEERNVEKCLASVKRFRQVFVVDSESTDRTRELANAGGATVVSFRWDGQYPKKKQWCLNNLRFDYDWVLYLDADEEVSPQCATEIAERVTGGLHVGYEVDYDYVFLGQILRHGRLVTKLVLLDRRGAYFPVQDDLHAENMWEVEGHYQPVVSGPTGHLRARLVHDDHDDLFHFFDRHNRYSDWEAAGRQLSPTRGGPSLRRRLDILRARARRLPGHGILAFAYCFIVKQGFRDGRAGLHYAIAMAFYFWQIDLKSSEMSRDRLR